MFAFIHIPTKAYLLIFFMCLIILTACDGTEVEPDSPDTVPEETFADLVNRIAVWPDPNTSSKEEPTTKPLYDPNSPTGQYCEITDYKWGSEMDEIITFTQSIKVWPGQLIQSIGLEYGDPVEIPGDRNPIRIAITHPTVDNQRVIEEPSYGTVSAAINDLVEEYSELNRPTIADVSLVIEKGYSTEQSLLKLGINARWLTASAKAALTVNEQSDKKTMMIKYYQPYFTVFFDNMPLNPEDLFDESVNINDLKNFVYETNPPAYVSSVTYGRMLIVKVESHRSFEEIDKAFSSSIKHILGGGGIDVDQETKSIIADSKVNVVVLGGSASNAIQVIEDLDFISFLQKEPNNSELAPGIPLSYKVNWLKNRQTAKFGLTTQYSIRECKDDIQKLEVKIDSLNIVKQCDNEGNDRSEIYFRFAAWPQGESNDEFRTEHLCGSNTIFMWEGDTHVIESSETMRLNLPKVDQSFFTVTGWIRDQKDNCDADQYDLPNPHNDGQYGKYNPVMGWHEYPNWETGSHSYTFKGGSCEAAVYYTVKTVD